MGWCGPTTYRQQKTWLAWKLMEPESYADPTMVCVYLMQVAQYLELLARGKAKEVGSYKLGYKEVPVERTTTKPTTTQDMHSKTPPLSSRKELITQQAKNRWFAVTGYKP